MVKAHTDEKKGQDGRVEKTGRQNKAFFVKAFKNEIPMLTSAIMCKGKD